MNRKNVYHVRSVTTFAMGDLTHTPTLNSEYLAGERSRDILLSARRERQSRHSNDRVDRRSGSRIRKEIQLKKVRISLSEIVAAAVETTNSLFQLKKHELRLDVPWANFDVDGDPMRLSQVVVNLLLNAARRTAPGGVVSVKGFRDGRELVIQVEDAGIGLAAEDAVRVWDGSLRAQPEALTADNSNMGLPFVKNITELHGGRVCARSRGLGLGSSFEVRLPRAVTEAARPHV